MKIPKIIHQIWSSKYKPYPPIFGKLADTWKHFHPDWNYILWNEELMEDFVRTYFPEYKVALSRFPYEVQRWDVMRYLILYKMGGFYLDCDYECRKNFEILLGDYSCCLGLEPDSHARNFHTDIYIGNALMAVTAGHPFMKELIENIINTPIPTDMPHNKIVYVISSTGPACLSNIYEKSIYREDIQLLSSKDVAPFSLMECRALIRGKKPNSYDLRKEKSWAIHYFISGWLDQLYNDILK